MRLLSRIVCTAGAVALLGCDGRDGGAIGLIDSGVVDAGPGVDAGLDCDPAPLGPECSNCIDDDGDGAIDGADSFCFGPWDGSESESLFWVTDWQPLHECFFDGPSPGDECDVSICCSLGAATQAECDEALGGHVPFDPSSDCIVSSQCRDYCEPFTPPDCDCFGCCHLCNDAGCFDVLVNPAVSSCDQDVLDDPSKCLRCTPIQDCMSLCGDTPECNVTADCGADEYCARGCCIKVVQ